MIKKILTYNLIVFLMLSLGVFPAMAETTEKSQESAGPGVYVSEKGSKSPRIMVSQTVKKTETKVEEETVAEKAVTGAGTELSAASAAEDAGVATVETVLTQEQLWEERVLADLLLEEQERPKTGELYHSARYYSTSATVTMSNLGEDDTVIRFLTEDEDLVFSAYIRKGQKIKVQIPGGVYRMRQAFGEKWYGEDDLFGNCGRYCDCTIGDEEFFEIKRSGRYVISTMGQGDAFSKVEISKEKF